LAERVTIPFDRVLDHERLSRAQAELGRTLRGSMRGHVELAVELELAGLQALEQQIERHDLGERGRMALRIRIGRVQHGAVIGVDHDVRIARGLGRGRGWSRARGRLLAAGARIGRIDRYRCKGNHRG
jgi:hypothetical protein